MHDSLLNFHSVLFETPCIVSYFIIVMGGALMGSRLHLPFWAVE